MKFVQFARTETRGGRVLKWSLERAWSCPLHERDVNEADYDYDEDEGREYDDDFECNGCRVAGWRVVYDADGWATVQVTEAGPFEIMLGQMRGPMIESLKYPNPLMTALAPGDGFDGVEVRVPIHVREGLSELPDK